MKPARNLVKVAASLSKQPPGKLAPISPQRTSASHTDTHSSQRKLQKENAKLRQELEELRCQYRQLVNEGPQEKYEERRVNLLKAQLMQLERQVVLLSEGLSSYACRSLDVEKVMATLTHTLSSLVALDAPKPEVTVSHSELTSLVDMCSSVTQVLHRNNKVNTVQGLSMPWVLAPPNLLKEPITLLDVCYGRMDGVNLQYVTSLDSGLSQLFKHLLGLKHSLQQIVEPCAALTSASEPSNTPAPEPGRVKAPRVVYERLLGQTSVCLSALELCCTDLLPLCLLGPQSPQVQPCPDVQMEMKAEHILSLLPALSRAAQPKAVSAAQAVARTHNHALKVARLQLEAAETELRFHGRLSSLHARQSQQLILGLEHAYRDFQDNMQPTLCEPLKDILSYYDLLVSSASEDALKDFLSAFERNQSQLRVAVEALATSQEQGEAALAQCQHDFLLAADRLRKGWEEQRDSVGVELKSLQEELSSARLLLDTLRSQRRDRDRPPAPGTHTCSQSDSPTPHTRPCPGDGTTLAPALHRLIKGDVTANERAALTTGASCVSRLGVSQQPRFRQGSTNQWADGKVLTRPPWQS